MYYRMLSIDGGGIKGLISLIWLNELDKRLSKPLCEYFDLFVGTSSGSLISCALAYGISTSEIMDLFEKEGKFIFKPLSKRLYHTLKNPLGPKHSSSGLEAVLKNIFGNSKFGDIDKAVISTAYDASRGEPILFFNKDDKDLMTWEVCRASSAAPIFFKPHIMEYNGKKCSMVDGGVVMNNPASFAMYKYLRERTDRAQRPFLLSVGTGSPLYELDPESVSNWNYGNWLLNVTSILIDGASDAVHSLIEDRVPNMKYYRLQGHIDNSGGIDDASALNISIMKASAEKWVDDHDELFDEITHLLEDNKT